MFKALESSSTWVIELRDEEEKATWIKALNQATYQASPPASVNVLGESGAEYGEPQATNWKAVDLVINGALVETKLLIYRKVNISRSDGDLAVKMKLHSLKIKDELQGSRSMNPQYLAFFVLKNDHSFSNASDSKGIKLFVVLPEDDDIFKDALLDFMSLVDPGIYAHNTNMAECIKIGNINDCLRLESAEALISDKDPGKGKGLPGEIFYEAQGSDNFDFVPVSFSTRNLGSPDYDGIDTQELIQTRDCRLLLIPSLLTFFLFKPFR